MTDNARNDVPAVAENRTSHRNFRRRKPWHQGRGSAQKTQGNKQGKPQPKIFFCGDPHGEFEYINRTVEKYHPDAIVILGDLQPPEDLETLLAPGLPCAIQKRCCPCIDTHKLPLGLPVRLAHGHQKVHSLSDLLKIRGSERILMQMLQNVPVSILQRCGHGRLKEIS